MERSNGQWSREYPWCPCRGRVAIRPRACTRFLPYRKVIKQTVMTSVYGVTLIGAKAQIYSQLHTRFEDLVLPADEREKVRTMFRPQDIPRAAGTALHEPLLVCACF